MKSRYRPLLILALLCAVVLPAAVLLWKAGGIGDPDKTGAGQRRAFDAAGAAGAAAHAEGERDLSRDAIDALIANGGTAGEEDAVAAQDAPPAGADELRKERAMPQEAWHEKERRVEAMRRSDARRAFLGNPALWPEPKSQRVAMALATMEHDMLCWAGACLDDPQGQSTFFLRTLCLRNLERMDKSLTDTSQLAPETLQELEREEAAGWQDARPVLPPGDRFRALMAVAKPAAVSAEEQSAAEFRAARYEEARGMLRELLMLEVLHEEISRERVQAGNVAPAAGAPRLEDVQGAVSADAAAARQKLVQLRGAAAQDWPGYLEHYSSARPAGAGP